jgi:hypothetical protein
MIISKRELAILAVISLGTGCATGPSGKTFESATGEWQTRTRTVSGKSLSVPMTIHNESSASYPFGGGRILFETADSQGRWEGYWVEDNGESMSCEQQKDGSNVWGAVVFRFNGAYNEFSGEYDACGEGKKYPWDGYR